MKELRSHRQEQGQGWKEKLHRFKERLAKRLWSLPHVSEREKELTYKNCLLDLDEFEENLSRLTEDLNAKKTLFEEENELLRSLMGVEQDDQKVKMINLTHELSSIHTRMSEMESDLKTARDQASNLKEENHELRKYIREAENRSHLVEAEQIRLRENEIKAFAESHQGLKNQVRDLESRLKNLRALFTKTNQNLLVEKQEEISKLQKTLLDEMEDTLRRRQNLLWAEEEMFAKGIAHKVRTALVSAQGQLYFSLERLGLLDPETKSESFLKSRLKLLMEGGQELSRNFLEVQTQLERVTSTLDEYLHLTHRRELRTENVSLKTIVQTSLAYLFVDRVPTLQVQILPDDPLPEVYVDEKMISFCVNTLVENAVDALPNKTGQITLTLKNNRNNKSVDLYVQDTGGGIPKHFISRLFEPFFTTKSGRRGLNLSRAKRYAELNDGELKLVKTGDDGTLFELKLPAKDRPQ